MAKGCSVTVASMKTMVSPASRMLRAISFGVFWRDAPSTRAIIRSRKLSPGLELTRTTIRSDSTLVPPVTDERSPPDSRMTGADSPVMADSSTEAMPSITSPSPGMSWPASTTQQSPSWSALDGVSRTDPSGWRTKATVSERVLRSVSAWALPRPSATASAKLANRTVNHSQAETSPTNTLSADVAVRRSRKNSKVVRTLPTSTTNMTGLRAMSRGSSLTKESFTARRMIAGSNSDVAPLDMAEMLDDRAEGHDREVGQADHDDHHRSQESGEEGSVGGKCSGRWGQGLLADEGPRDGQHRHHEQVAAGEHAQTQRRVEPLRVAGEPAEGGTVVVAGRGEGVGHLRQAVGAVVGQRRHSRLQQHGRAGEAEDGDRHRQEVQDDQLHLDGLDLLAEVLGGPAHHQPGDEHAGEGEDEHAVEAGTRPARADLTQHHVDQRHRTAERRHAVVLAVDRPG